MNKCIFCDKKTEYSIGNKGKSICLDCLIEFKKLELKYKDVIVQKVLPSNIKNMIKDARNVIEKIPVDKLDNRDKELLKKAKKAIQ